VAVSASRGTIAGGGGHPWSSSVSWRRAHHRSWIPQLVRVWRTRSTDDLSWGYLGTFASGVFLWLVYGLYREDPAIVLANGFTFAAVLGIIELKRRGPRTAG
jgi:MtN3 and saliva related transmembrane protein